MGLYILLCLVQYSTHSPICERMLLRRAKSQC